MSNKAMAEVIGVSESKVLSWINELGLKKEMVRPGSYKGLPSKFFTWDKNIDWIL